MKRCLLCSHAPPKSTHDSDGVQIAAEVSGRGKSKHASSPVVVLPSGDPTALIRRRNRVRFGYSLVKGRSKRQMEDHHVAEFRIVKNMELGCFAIFDGHLGHSVSIYLQQHLFDNILNQANFWSDPRSAILDAYAQTDNVIVSKTKELGRGGSTAVTAIVVDNCKLVVANIGDSRAVLCKGGASVQLSVDHEPRREQRSIENMGGYVSNIPGDVPRVDGQLAVSRAFGDKSLKMHLRSDPDIQIEDIDEAFDFLILASDGLWKVMENQIAVDLIKAIKDPQEAAKSLTSQALALGSKDDISCIVVQFR